MVLASRYAAKLRTKGELQKKLLTVLAEAVEEWVAM